MSSNAIRLLDERRNKGGIWSSCEDSERQTASIACATQRRRSLLCGTVMLPEKQTTKISLFAGASTEFLLCFWFVASCLPFPCLLLLCLLLFLGRAKQIKNELVHNCPKTARSHTSNFLSLADPNYFIVHNLLDSNHEGRGSSAASRCAFEPYRCSSW